MVVCIHLSFLYQLRCSFTDNFRASRAFLVLKLLKTLLFLDAAPCICVSPVVCWTLDSVCVRRHRLVWPGGTDCTRRAAVRRGPTVDTAPSSAEPRSIPPDREMLGASGPVVQPLLLLLLILLLVSGGFAAQSGSVARVMHVHRSGVDLALRYSPQHRYTESTYA